MFPWEQAVPYETIKIQRNWTWDPPTPRSFTDDAELNMVKKFYIVSCAALVACLCLFPQDAGAGGQQSRATARAHGAHASRMIRPVRRATINRRQRAGIGKLKGSTQGPDAGGPYGQAQDLRINHQFSNRHTTKRRRPSKPTHAMDAAKTVVQTMVQRTTQ